MTRQIKVGKGLSCGCCGEWFHTWEGYVDQDQDDGYGICKPCQGLIEADNQRELDKLVACVRDGLNPENRAKYVAMPKDQQEAYAMQLLDEGHIKMSIVRG